MKQEKLELLLRAEDEDVAEKVLEILVDNVGEFSNIQELSTLLKVSESNLRANMDNGEIVYFRVGMRIVIITRSLLPLLKKYL